MPAESEDYVIGALLMDHRAMNRIDLLPGEFQNKFCADIYEAMMDLAAQNVAFDFGVVSDELSKRTGEDWIVPLAERARQASGSSIIESHAKLVRRDHQRMQAKDIAMTLATDVDEKDMGAVDQAIAGLMQLNVQEKKREFSIKQASKVALEAIETAIESEGLIGISSGIDSIDSSLTGFRKSELYVVGARPAMGKTALLLNFAYKADVPVGIISAEQGHEQIGLRLFSISGKLDSQKVRKADLDEDDYAKLTAACGILGEKDIWIYDKPAPSILEVMRQARQWKHKYNIKALYVDYIQRIKGINPRASKIERVGQVAECLKELARELDIPVIALSQVNREVDKRADKRPGMSDLSDASEIEKEADCVMTLYRDEVYYDSSDRKGVAEIIICKNRHGPTGLVTAAWQGPFMVFENLTVRYGYE